MMMGMDDGDPGEPRDHLNRLLGGQLPPFTNKLKPAFRGKRQTLTNIKRNIDGFGFDPESVEQGIPQQDVTVDFMGTDLQFTRNGLTTRFSLKNVKTLATLVDEGWNLKLEKKRLVQYPKASVAVTATHPDYCSKNKSLPLIDNMVSVVLLMDLETESLCGDLEIPRKGNVALNEKLVGFQLLGLDLSPDQSILAVSWKLLDPDTWNLNRCVDNTAFIYFYDVSGDFCSAPIHCITKNYEEDCGDPSIAFDPSSGHSCFTLTFPKRIETVTIRLPMERYRFDHVPVIETGLMNLDKQRGISVTDSTTLLDAKFESLFSKQQKLRYTPDGRYIVYLNSYSTRGGFGMYYGGKMKMEVVILDAADVNHVIGRHKFQWKPDQMEPESNVDWFTIDNVVHFSKYSESVLIIENVSKTADSSLLVDYMVVQLPQKLNLQDICRKIIRKSAAGSDDSIARLPLPSILKNYLNYKHTSR
ncbi:uncharacterized protein LOC141912560 [Tubulanus polymorphus]|uniref:uncharacterized protein LOC141912560 n=1 Tax=Tubulanus polymorphus TaxID=672921 RepID=UPI003DA4038F